MTINGRPPEIYVNPVRSMVDVPLGIRLMGFASGQQVTLRASQTDDLERTWRAHATFVADSNGQVDVAAQAPVSGTYTEADRMGLIWSMALAYFNYEGLPQDLIEIPLEYFETAIGWLQRRPDLDGDRIAVSGTSRGGELVLLLGATFPAVKAVIAYVPSGIVHGGIGRSGV